MPGQRSGRETITVSPAFKSYGFAAPRTPVGYGLAAGGGEELPEAGSAFEQADDVGGGAPAYPPIPGAGTAPTLTAAQVADMATACAQAMSNMQPVRLAQPFTYLGPSVPGMQNGDYIEGMYPAEPGQGTTCITSAEYARQHPPSMLGALNWTNIGIAVAGGVAGYALGPKPKALYAVGAAVAALGAKMLYDKSQA